MKIKLNQYIIDENKVENPLEMINSLDKNESI